MDEAFEEMCTLHAVIMLCFCCWQGLANRSMRLANRSMRICKVYKLGRFQFHGLLEIILFAFFLGVCVWGGGDVYREG